MSIYDDCVKRLSIVADMYKSSAEASRWEIALPIWHRPEDRLPEPGNEPLLVITQLPPTIHYKLCRYSNTSSYASKWIYDLPSGVGELVDPPKLWCRLDDAVAALIKVGSICAE